MEIAEMFGVSRRYIYKLLDQREDSGDLSPLPHGGGARPKLSDDQKLKVVDLVAEMPDVTIGELRQTIKKRLRVEVSIGTVWNVLDSLDLPRKKSPASRAKRIQKSVPRSVKDSRG